MDDAGHVEAIGAQGVSRLPNSLLMDLRATMPSPTHTSSLPTFTSEEVLAEALTYFHGDDLAATTWLNKYALRNADGRLVERNPADMHRRMAKEFARIETRYAPLPSSPPTVSGAPHWTRSASSSSSTASAMWCRRAV